MTLPTVCVLMLCQEKNRIHSRYKYYKVGCIYWAWDYIQGEVEPAALFEAPRTQENAAWSLSQYMQLNHVGASR